MSFCPILLMKFKDLNDFVIRVTQMHECDQINQILLRIFQFGGKKNRISYLYPQQIVVFDIIKIGLEYKK